MLARLLLLAVVFLSGSAFAADPYQWVGVTSVAFTGDGNGLGFVGMTTQCRADFGPGARMCTSQEILESDTLNPNAIPPDGCWARPSWAPNGIGVLDESGSYASAATTLSCQSWTSNGAGSSGLALMPNGSIGWFSQAGGQISCDQSRPVACCKPTPVPTPSASNSLPIGAAGLLGLSFLKAST